MPITKPLTLAKQSSTKTTAQSTGSSNTAPKSTTTNQNSAAACGDTSCDAIDKQVTDSVETVSEIQNVPKRTSLKERFTKSLKKAALVKQSSKQQLEAKVGSNSTNPEEKLIPDQDNPTSLTLESKTAPESREVNTGKQLTSLVESSAPTALESDVTAQDTHAHTGEVLPSTPPPPYDVTGGNGVTDNSQSPPPPYSPLNLDNSNTDKVEREEENKDKLSNSETIEQQSASSPTSATPDSVLKSLDESIEAGNSSAESVISMNPNTKSNTDLESKSSNVDDRENEPEPQVEIEEENVEVSESVPNVKPDGIIGPTDKSEQLLPEGDRSTPKTGNCEAEVPACDKKQPETIKTEEELNMTSSESLPVVESVPSRTLPKPLLTDEQKSQVSPTLERKSRNVSETLHGESALKVSEAILEQRGKLRPSTGPGSSTLTSKFYPASGKTEARTEINISSNSGNKNCNVKNLVNRFNQVPDNISTQSENNDDISTSSLVSGTGTPTLEDNIKTLTESSFKDQFLMEQDSQSSSPGLRLQHPIPEISVRNMTLMFESPGSSVAITPILPRKGSNTSSGYSPMTNRKFRNNDDGLHPYWSESSSNTSDSDSDASDESFLASRRPSEISRVLSDIGSDISNETENDIVSFAGEIVENAFDNGVAQSLTHKGNDLNVNKDVPPTTISESETGSEAPKRSEPLDIADYPAPPPLAQDSTTVPSSENKTCTDTSGGKSETTTSEENTLKENDTDKPNITSDDPNASECEDDKDVKTQEGTRSNGEQGENVTNEKEAENVEEQLSKSTEETEKQAGKKFQRGKRSTIRRKLTEEEIKKVDGIKEDEVKTETDKSAEIESQEKKITRKRGSTIKRKVPLNKTDSRTSINSSTSEIGPDGIHYKPGFV